jgi:hypothetical protein
MLLHQCGITVRRQWSMRLHLLCITVRHLFIIAQHLRPILDTMVVIIGTMTASAAMSTDGVKR